MTDLSEWPLLKDQKQPSWVDFNGKISNVALNVRFTRLCALVLSHTVKLANGYILPICFRHVVYLPQESHPI